MIFMKRLFILITIAMISFAFSSCEKENDNSEYNNSGRGNNQNENTDVYRLVQDNLRCNKQYTHKYYMYKVDIVSSLSSAYPGHSINYGVECGYCDYAYYKTKSGSGSIEFKVPIFTDVNRYCQNEPWAFSLTDIYPSGKLPDDEEMQSTIYYAKIYYALQEMIDAGQTLDEGNTANYNGAKNKLDAVESRAKGLFVYRVYVSVDGNKYYL